MFDIWFFSSNALYFLLSSLPSPSSWALDCHIYADLSVCRELVLCDISACVAHFFRLFNVVNNLFTQKKDSNSICFIDGAWVSDNFQRMEVTHYWECILSHTKNSWCTLNWTPVCWSKFLQSKRSFSELWKNDLFTQKMYSLYQFSQSRFCKFIQKILPKMYFDKKKIPLDEWSPYHSFKMLQQRTIKVTNKNFFVKVAGQYWSSCHFY